MSTAGVAAKARGAAPRVHPMRESITVAFKRFQTFRACVRNLTGRFLNAQCISYQLMTVSHLRSRHDVLLRLAAKEHRVAVLSFPERGTVLQQLPRRVPKPFGRRLALAVVGVAPV